MLVEKRVAWADRKADLSEHKLAITMVEEWVDQTVDSADLMVV